MRLKSVSELQKVRLKSVSKLQKVRLKSVNRPKTVSRTCPFSAEWMITRYETAHSFAPPLTPYRDMRRVSIGYRLDIDWSKVEATEIHHRMKTNDKPKFDHINIAREGVRANRGYSRKTKVRGKGGVESLKKPNIGADRPRAKGTT